MSKVIALSMLSLVVLMTFVLSLVMANESLTSAGQSDENGGFKPVVEAPMPVGFPPYTPVGEIQVKNYPAYRKAEASGRTAFWTLFQHIQNAGVSMTAPVEMTYRNDGPPVGREQAMAFLYGDKNTGSAGRQGNVEVVDVPSTAVVSIGLRGERSESAMRQAEQRLGRLVSSEQGSLRTHRPPSRHGIQ